MTTPFKLARKCFLSLEPGTQLTCKDLMAMASIPFNEPNRKAVSVLLCSLNTAGRVERIGKKGWEILYRVPGRFERETAPAEHRKEDDLDSLQVGEAVIDFILELRNKITELEAKLAVKDEELEQVRKERADLERLYQQAQEKILQLSRHGSKRRNRAAME